MQTSRLFSHHVVLVAAAAALVLLLCSPSLVLQAEAATRTVLGVGDPSELFTNMSRSYRFSSDVTSFQLEEASVGTGPSLLREVKIGEKDFIVSSSKLANTTEDGWVQVPMAAFALSLIFPVKQEALETTPTRLSIDTTSLLGIYVGELTTWMDAAPAGWFYMAVPDPSAPITFYVQHYEDEASEFASTQGLLGRALCNLTDKGEHIPNTDVFCAAYKSNGNRLVPTLEQFNPGRVVALPIGTTPLELIGSLANSTAGLALSTMSAALAYDLLSVQIESSAGVLSEVQLNQAIPGVGAIVAGESLAIDILNSKTGWPFSALQFVSVPRESVVRGCAYLQSVADFLVWGHTNNMAIDLITQLPHYGVLNSGIRSIAATSVSTVTCNGQAVVVPAVSAAGPPTLLLNSWASGYESSSAASSIRLAYETYLFDVTNAESATSGLTDVAVTFDYREHNETMSMSTIPVAAEPLVAIYNVPEIALSVTAIPLVLSADLAVKILFGDLIMWNAPEIAALNPELAGVLPNETIRLVLDKGGSPFSSGGPSGGPDNRALLSWIHSLVPSFKNITFPVEADTERAIGAQDSGVTSVIKDMPYSLGWGGLSAALAERSVRIAFHLRSGGAKRQSSNWLAPERDAILATLNDNYSASNPNTTGFMLPALVSQNPDAWPIARWVYFYTRGNSSATSTAQGIQCTKLAALVEWIFWTQTDTKQAPALADGEGMVSFVSGDSVRSKQLINTLASMQCYGEPVFVLMACVNDGTICSDHGQCQANSQNTTTYQCRCDSGWQGTLCETPVDSDDGGEDNLVIGLAVGLSAGACLILILLVLVGTVPALIVTKFAGRRGRPEWEIRMSEIQNLELIGQGGYGKVYKATWKGTEVAVKVIDRNRQPDTKRARQAFVKEIEHMSLLRNPNIVMFMAAATSTVPMCIVMEYMALGSLYDLLHNELIDHMPFQLKSLILLHIARGMNFLHSSDVVHRDLKSLNVLLDSKWNAKVADFGLSTLGSGPRDRAQFEGSVPWAAPEILNEQNDADLFAADVYSFGIITWEVLTRDQPYRGKSPAAVAVAVLRDKCRPPIAAQEEYGTLYLERDNLELLPYVETVVCLIESCWSEEVSVRPTFLEITSNLANLVSRVKAVHNGGSSTSGMMTGSMTSSSDYSGGGYGGMGRDNSSRSHGSSTNSKNSMDRNTYEPRRGNALRRYHYYDGPHAIVCSDVAMAGTLWSNVPEAMKDATRLHNELLRGLLARYGGYETMLPKIEGGAAGTFCMAFATTADALLWCADVQRALLEADWPAALLQCPPAEELNAGGLDDKLIFRGLRVRMGVHHGTPRCHIDSLTHHIEYTGPAVQKTQELASRAAGGVVLLSAEAYHDLKRDRASAGSVIEGGSRIRALMDTMADEGATLYELVLPGLEARCLRTIVKDTMPLHRRRLLEGSAAANKARLASEQSAYDSSSSDSDSDDDRRNDSKVADLNTSLSFIDPLASASMSMVHDDRGHRPDHRKEPVELGFLNSANMCRTIINYREILVEKPIGSGSFGIVHKARWKGVPVAVKTLTAKKRLSEEDMLDFRYEIAVLADLNHLNVLAFIGACLNEPHLAIVTEYMGRGSLRDVLHSTSSKLPWPMRLRMLRDAADGVRYLHTRASPIIHRDLKSSNLLVDDNWTVKVGDFGLARIKGDNATMTRCGTPAWTAPEVLSSNSYDEKADVYSFGVVMWEVLTRRQPYEGRNFIKVTMDVLKGDRPTIPADCPSDFSKLMRKCWHANPHKRPAMESVVSAIERMMQGHDDEQVPSSLIIADNV